MYTYSKPEPWNLNSGFLTRRQLRLWQGLVSLVPMWHGGAEWDYVRNQPLTPTTSLGGLPTWALSRRGMVSEATFGAQRGLSFGTSDFVPLDNVSILIHKRKTDGTNRASAHFGPYQSSASNQRCGATLPYSDGNIYFDFGGFSNGNTRLTVGGLTFGDDFWMFTVGPRGMECWQNGYLRGSHGNRGTRSASAAPFYIHLGNSEVVQDSDSAECAFFAMWNYQLSYDDCRDLSVDPWQLIRYERSPARAAAAAGTVVGTVFRSPVIQGVT